MEPLFFCSQPKRSLPGDPHCSSPANSCAFALRTRWWTPRFASRDLLIHNSHRSGGLPPSAHDLLGPKGAMEPAPPRGLLKLTLDGEVSNLAVHRLWPDAPFNVVTVHGVRRMWAHAGGRSSPCFFFFLLLAVLLSRQLARANSPRCAIASTRAAVPSTRGRRRVFSAHARLVSAADPRLRPGRRFVVGSYVANLLQIETFNFYSSCHRRRIPVRSPPLVHTLSPPADLFGATRVDAKLG